MNWSLENVLRDTKMLMHFSLQYGKAIASYVQKKIKNTFSENNEMKRFSSRTWFIIYISQ